MLFFSCFALVQAQEQQLRIDVADVNIVQINGVNNLRVEYVLLNLSDTVVSAPLTTFYLLKGESLNFSGNIFGELELVDFFDSNAPSLSPRAGERVVSYYEIPAGIKSGSYYLFMDAKANFSLQVLGTAFFKEKFSLNGSGTRLPVLKANLRYDGINYGALEGPKISSSAPSLVFPLFFNPDLSARVLSGEKFFGKVEVYTLGEPKEKVLTIGKKELILNSLIDINGPVLEYVVEGVSSLKPSPYSVELILSTENGGIVSPTSFFRIIIPGKAVRMGEILYSKKNYCTNDNIDLNVNFFVPVSDRPSNITVEVTFAGGVVETFSKSLEIPSDGTNEFSIDFSDLKLSSNISVDEITVSIKDSVSGDVYAEKKLSGIQNSVLLGEKEKETSCAPASPSAQFDFIFIGGLGLLIILLVVLVFVLVKKKSKGFLLLSIILLVGLYLPNVFACAGSPNITATDSPYWWNYQGVDYCCANFEIKCARNDSYCSNHGGFKVMNNELGRYIFESTQYAEKYYFFACATTSTISLRGDSTCSGGEVDCCCGSTTPDPPFSCPVACIPNCGTNLCGQASGCSGITCGTSSVGTGYSGGAGGHCDVTDACGFPRDTFPYNSCVDPSSSCGSETQCDDIDNDCDGYIDKGLKNACGTCGDVPTEVCNGVDDDCDGSIDEGFNKGNSCSVGVGACTRSGTIVCKSDGSSGCSVSAGTPSCSAPFCGLSDGCGGYCSSSSIGSGYVNNCDSTDACGNVRQNGLYNMCDLSSSASCGVESSSQCDGINNNCDSTVDEDFNLGSSCSVGSGACLRNGATVCKSGAAACNAIAGTPPACSTLGAECGSISDTCGGTLNCGSCVSGKSCVSNRCVVCDDLSITNFSAVFSDENNSLMINSSCSCSVGDSNILITGDNGYSKKISGLNCSTDGALVKFVDANLPQNSVVSLTLNIPTGCAACTKTIFVSTPIFSSESVPDNNLVLVLVVLLMVIGLIAAGKKK